MADIAYKIYKPISKKELGFVRKGTCVGYVPKAVNLDEHITIDFGDMQIMFDKTAFMDLCDEVMDVPYTKKPVTKLYLIKR